MDYREYYGTPFASDLAQFRQWAEMSRFFHKENPEGVYAIQPYLITSKKEEIKSWGDERIALFATALFYTILIDQVCYTFFRRNYNDFQYYTRYPKLKGDCPSGCRNNMHPSNTFRLFGNLMDYEDSIMEDVFKSRLLEALPIMEKELFDFVITYIPTMDKELFWERCLPHIPYS